MTLGFVVLVMIVVLLLLSVLRFAFDDVDLFVWFGCVGGFC